MAGSGLVAGPCTTEPSLMLNLLPWQGQLMVPFETLLTKQPACVQIAVNALKNPDSGCVITMRLARAKATTSQMSVYLGVCLDQIVGR